MPTGSGRGKISPRASGAVYWNPPLVHYIRHFFTPLLNKLNENTPLFIIISHAKSIWECTHNCIWAICRKYVSWVKTICYINVQNTALQYV